MKEIIVGCVIFIMGMSFGALVQQHRDLNKTPKFDCKEDYCGWVVVEDRHDTKIVSKDGCKDFKEIRLPDLYDYSLGDTICKSSTVMSEIERNIREKMRAEKEYEEALYNINNER